MTASTDTADGRSTQAGRLHDPAMDLRTDPRVKAPLLAALAAFGLDAAAGPPPFGRDAGPERINELVGQQDAGFNGLYAALPNELPGDDDRAVDFTTRTITGADGNEIVLGCYRPAGVTGELPGVVYIHGGGMTILDTFAKVHQQWCHDLAATGLVVVAVDFRNAWTAKGMNPFPAGLTDCVSAVAWLDDHRAELGITRLVLQGESGGANLVLATAIKTARDGRTDAIAGVYASVPYISGGYGWDEARKRRELPSMVENDGYFLNCESMDLLVAAYDPTGEHAEDPLCWPYFATESDVAGLPPHVITVNELDPLRDEGMAYFRLLQRAGVPSVGRVNLGLVHGAELIFRQAVADDYFASVRAISSFAGHL